MKHTLVHLYGPLSIHSYGVMIALGLILFIYFIKRDPRFSRVGLEDHLTGALLVGILAALIGGRLLFIATNPSYISNFSDIFAFWEPGFSILGSVSACVLAIPLYLKYYQIPIIAILDLAALYTPLLQSVARLGCFFAGCCYGLPTSASWGIVYSDPESVAPLGVCLHPTQLYSSFSLFLIFIVLYFVTQRLFTKNGQLASCYLMLISLERFSVDFFRGDRFEVAHKAFAFSPNQLVACFLFLVGIGLFIIFSRSKSHEHI